MYPRLLTALILFGIGFAPLFAQTYTVDTLADNTTTDGTCTLREAIEAINTATPNADCPASGGGPEIVFSVAGTIVLGGTELEITADMTITGGGNITIDANQLSRVLHVSNAGATIGISGLDITRGKAPSELTSGNGLPGGGIYNVSTLTIDNSRIFDNDAGGNWPSGNNDGGMGGGIYNTGTATLTDCEIDANRGGRGGNEGATSIGGSGGGIANMATMNLLRTYVRNNIAGTGGFDTPDGRAGNGGGIYNTGTLILENSTISGNKGGNGSSIAGIGTGGSGGGIYNTLSGELSLTDTIIENNITGRGGGGFFGDDYKQHGYGGGLFNKGEVTIIDGESKNNKAHDGLGFPPGIGITGGFAGGIYNTGILNMTGSALTGNHAGDSSTLWDYDFGSGHGGIAGGLYNSGTATLTDLLIEDNHAGDGRANESPGGGGGGVYNTNTLTLNRVTVHNNTSGDAGGQGSFHSVFAGRGGGIYSEGILLVTNSTFTGNTTGTGNTNRADNQGGGGLYSTETALIQNSTITGNTLGSCGTCPNNHGGGINVGGGTTTLYSTLIAENTGDTGGNDLAGTFTTQGFNLIDDAAGFTGLTDGLNNDQVGVAMPGLLPLADNGGSTQTHALDPASPAVDQGDCTTSGIATDQRGITRPIDQLSIPNAGDGCDIGAFEFEGQAVAIGFRFLLGGAYDVGASPTGRHQLMLNEQDLIPLAQPYSNPLFDGTPMDYDGTEAVSEVPGNRVDWIIVELRTSTDAASTVARKAAFLLRGGSVYDIDGMVKARFYGVPTGDYYVVVRHRNHLPLMTATPVTLTTGDFGAYYPFWNDPASAYGTNAMIEMEPGIWTLWPGDGNGDGQVTAFDFLNVWLPANGSAGYQQGDFNMDGSVTAFDFLQSWLPSNGRVSQVPE